MGAASIAVSKAVSGQHNPNAEEKALLGLKKPNPDGRTFLTVLKQALARSGKKKRVNFGNEGVGKKAENFRKVKKTLINRNRLSSSKLEIRAGKIREKLSYLGSDEGKGRSRQEVEGAPGGSLVHPVPAANGPMQLAGMADSENRREDGNTPITRRAIDGKDKDNLTSTAPRVEVQDRRARAARANPASQVRNFEHYLGRAGEDAEGESGLENRPMRADMEIEIPTRFEGRDSPRSAAMEFARRLDGQVGNEIVRQIRIVLNRSSAGELRINLKPENLGRVRVEIQLEDNHLRGKFFVESSAAREVFKGALDGLQTKLLESGFGTADLEMGRDDSSPDFRFSSGNSRDRKAGDAASELEKNLPVNAFIELDDNLVNLVV